MKKKTAWDLHGHPSPIVKIYFQKQNHNQAKVDRLDLTISLRIVRLQKLELNR